MSSTAIAKVGRWWFQRRSVTPLPLFLLLVLLPPQFSLSGIPLVLTVVGILASEGLRLWAVGYAGSATRTRGDSVPVLVHAGPFRHLRNPLYVANTVMYTLTACLFGFYQLSLVMFAFSIVQYSFIVAFEEETLIRTFGSSYERYCEKVPRWVPSLLPRIEASQHAFHLKKALRSERSTLFAMAAMTALYLVKARSFREGT